MKNTRVFTFGLAAVFTTLVALNWDGMMDVQTMRLVDASVWASFCF